MTLVVISKSTAFALLSTVLFRNRREISSIEDEEIIMTMIIIIIIIIIIIRFSHCYSTN